MAFILVIDFVLATAQAPNAALQRPGDNGARGKLSMRDTLIPVRCKRLFGAALSKRSITKSRTHATPYMRSNKMKYATTPKIPSATKPCQRGSATTPKTSVSNEVSIAIRTNIPAVLPELKTNLIRMKTTIQSETAALA
jgi:hypothetical protein